MKEFKKKFGALCLALSALTWSIPNVARAEFVKQEVPSVHNSGVDEVEDACEGYTSQTCDVVRTNADGSTSRTSQTFNCCGKTECENMLDPKDPTRCKVSRVFAHGSKDTCTDPVQTSPCGMSCCGSVDCSTVCVNYRMNVCEGYNSDANGNKCCGLDDCEKSKCNYWTVTTEEMGTPGIACCGYLDCANKACGGYTSTESKVYPDKGKLACCGKEDCERMSCGGITETTGAYGGLAGLPCCGDGPNLEGVPNCRKTECQDYIETTSVSDTATNKKKLECCGPGNNPDLPVSYQWGNCWQVHCDNQTSTIVEDTKDENGKNGTTVACCGYADCLDKQCSGQTSYIPYGKGPESAVPCCGKKKCEELYLATVPTTFYDYKNNFWSTPVYTYEQQLGEKPFKDIFVQVRANNINYFAINGVNLTAILHSDRHEWITLAGCPYTGGGLGTKYDFYVSRRSLESLGIEFPDNKIIIQYQEGYDKWGCRSGYEWWVTLYYE